MGIFDTKTFVENHRRTVNEPAANHQGTVPESDSTFSELYLNNIDMRRFRARDGYGHGTVGPDRALTRR